MEIPFYKSVVNVLLETCLANRYLAMAVFSEFTISAFWRRVTVSMEIPLPQIRYQRSTLIQIFLANRYLAMDLHVTILLHNPKQFCSNADVDVRLDAQVVADVEIQQFDLPT
jgi:hypothetical protein